MAIVKVFLPTYKRNETFKRAIQSLINQTFTDWVCEVHNDDPGDDFPANYISIIKDDRIHLFQHPVNLGGIKTFNLFFEPKQEKYFCQLEDDNWWQPEFLSHMVNLMEQNPDIEVGFCDMFVWEEQKDGNWIKQNQTIWGESQSQLIYYPTARHAGHFYHSNGSMLIRSENAENYIVPNECRMDFVEHVRERSFPHPLLFANIPLVNFALTLSTSRSKSIKGINEHYYLLLASFFIKADIANKFCNEIWTNTRKSKIRATNKLIYAGLFDSNCSALLRNARVGDWLFFVAYNLKHPIVLFRCIFAKQIYKELWIFLKFNSENRYKEIIEFTNGN